MKLYLISVTVSLVLYILNGMCSRLTGKYITKNQKILMTKGEVVNETKKSDENKKSIKIGTFGILIISLTPFLNILLSIVLLVMLISVLFIKASVKRVINS